MLKDIRKQLIDLARLKTTWSYSQLNDQLELGDDPSHRNLIGEWLGEVSEHEYNKGRPLLSALITHKASDREQGDGFYKLCEKWYGKPWHELKEDKSFEIERIKECYSFWKDNNNYSNYKSDY